MRSGSHAGTRFAREPQCGAQSLPSYLSCVVTDRWAAFVIGGNQANLGMLKMIARLTTAIVIAGSLITSATMTSAEPNWTRITAAEELKALLVGRFVVMYTDRIQFHRDDGNMIEHFAENDSLMFRRWTFEGDGKLCWRIFSKPDRVIDCTYIEKSDSDPVKYRYNWINAGSKPPLEFLEGTRAELIDALESEAGPSVAE